MRPELGNDVAELVGDVELVGVEEEEDEVGPAQLFVLVRARDRGQSGSQEEGKTGQAAPHLSANHCTTSAKS